VFDDIIGLKEYFEDYKKKEIEALAEKTA